MADKNIEFSIPVSVAKERIEDLLVGAFEGGSNYWISEVNIIRQAAGADYASETPMRGGVIEIVDGEDDDHKKYLVTEYTLVNGLKLFAESKEMAHHWKDFITENEDATTADVFLQFCLFGKVIYG